MCLRQIHRPLLLLHLALRERLEDDVADGDELHVDVRDPRGGGVHRGGRGGCCPDGPWKR